MLYLAQYPCISETQAVITNYIPKANSSLTVLSSSRSLAGDAEDSYRFASDNVVSEITIYC